VGARDLEIALALNAAPKDMRDGARPDAVTARKTGCARSILISRAPTIAYERAHSARTSTANWTRKSNL